MECMKLSRATNTLLLLLLSCILLRSVLTTADRRVLFDEGSKDDDYIDELPNQPDSADFRQYSGYVIVEPAVNGRYFYYFVEAAGEKPTSKPLILYMGCSARKCSSLLPAFQQVGPFKVEFDGQTLDSNPYSWNQFANIIFVDGPVGLGFAKSDDKQEIFKSHDVNTAIGMHTFLVRWLERFPEYKKSDVYIAGQNYIGVLGPIIGNHILAENAKSKGSTINLKGLLMGNPTLDDRLDHNAAVEYLYGNNIIAESILVNFFKYCDMDDEEYKKHYEACIPYKMDINLRVTELDPFTVYGKICPNVDWSMVTPDTYKLLMYQCEDENVAGYFNIPFVQSTVHVTNPPVYWSQTDFDTDWVREISSAKDYIKALLANEIKILAYYGVLDYENTVIGAQMIFNNISIPVKSDWRPWFSSPLELAGYTETYSDGLLTLATVRGSGRKVSEDQPRAAFTMVKSFLENIPLPNSPYFNAP